MFPSCSGVARRFHAPDSVASRDGRFEPVTDLKEASRLAARQLGLGAQLIGPGSGARFLLWNAFQTALKTLPTPPSWPTWRP